jgi:hypothetical protein
MNATICPNSRFAMRSLSVDDVEGVRPGAGDSPA